MLEGWGRSFPSVRDLRAALQDCSLRAGDDCFSLRRCCLPRPGGTEMGAPRGNWGGGRPRPSVTALRDHSHPQRSPTSSSHVGLRPAPDRSISVISASTGSARKTSPRCVAGVGGWGAWGELAGGGETGIGDGGWDGGEGTLKVWGTREAALSRCHGDLPLHLPLAVPLGPGHKDQRV